MLKPYKRTWYSVRSNKELPTRNADEELATRGENCDYGVRVYVASLETPLLVALSVIKRLAVTPVLEIVKVAVLLPAATITPAGKDSVRLEPLSATFTPPTGAGPVKVTVPVRVVVPETVLTDVDRDCKPVGAGASTAGSTAELAFAIVGRTTPAIIIEMPTRAVRPTFTTDMFLCSKMLSSVLFNAVRGDCLKTKYW